MPASAPLPRIGAEYPLGLGIQSALGTPAAITQWINQTANTLNPATGAHMIDSAMGTRATEQESAQGETKVEGGFECDLRTSTIRGVVEALLGGTPTTSAGIVTIPVGRPSLLTIYDAWGGEAHQYQDCILGQGVFSCSNHLEWHAALTVLGGLETLVPTVVPAVPTGDNTLAWSDVQGITGMSAVAGQISQWSFTINNNPKQDFGAGQHAATSTIGGKLQIDGSAMIRYDDANAAAVHAAYKAGTDLGPTTLTIGAAGGTTATGTATEAAGAVTGVTITNGGSGYTSGATVTFTGGGGTGAAGTPVVSGGVITGVTITSGGTGYTSAPTVAFSAPVGNQHVIYFPNITLLTCVPQKPLDDLSRLSVTFGCKRAEQFTWSMPA